MPSASAGGGAEGYGGRRWRKTGSKARCTTSLPSQHWFHSKRVDCSWALSVAVANDRAWDDPTLDRASDWEYRVRRHLLLILFFFWTGLAIGSILFGGLISFLSFFLAGLAIGSIVFGGICFLSFIWWQRSGSIPRTCFHFEKKSKLDVAKCMIELLTWNDIKLLVQQNHRSDDSYVFDKVLSQVQALEALGSFFWNKVLTQVQPLKHWGFYM